MPLERGAVYLVPTEMSEASGATGRRVIDKYHVVLQNPGSIDPNARNYAYVLASRDRSSGGPNRIFEVRVGQTDGFDVDTMVDGRWVYTGLRDALLSERYQFTLSPDRMDQISVAIFDGLQLDP